MKSFALCAFALALCVKAAGISAGESEAPDPYRPDYSAEDGTQSPRAQTAFPESGPAPDLPPAGGDKPFVLFHEGLSVSWLTRIIKQTGRSNFVFRDFLPGLYCRMELRGTKYGTPTFRLAAYYPLRSSFNGFPQKSRTPLHYGADFIAGLQFQALEMKYLRLNIAPGLHVFFLNSDRWNYLHAGAVCMAGLEAPLTSGWTILLNGLASLDYGNLGNNKVMEPFDIVYQYQINIGGRYSRKTQNSAALFSKTKN
jgi:hypothetical protein